jgi:Xaa-Pro dipeptidase
VSHRPARGFEVAEFEDRLARAHKQMEMSGLDALLLTTEADVRYFSGFLTRFWESPTRPWFLVIPSEGEPIAVIPEIGASLMETTWLDDIRTWASPRPEDEGVTLLVELLGPCSRIGLPMGPETTLRMPLSDYAKLRDSLPDVEFEDATELIAGVRMIKSDTEIDKIRHICAIASDAFDRVPDLVEREMPLSEVFRGFKMMLLELGADDVPYLVGASSQGGYGDVISPPSERPVMPGDLLMMDTGAVYDGYFCDFDRNYALGEADAAVKKAHEALHEATEAGLDAARVGATCADVYSAMADVVASSGYETGNVGRSGHGLGAQLTEKPSVTPSDHTLLADGMVMTLEPGLFIAPGRTMVHEENIVIRKSGRELLSRRAPATLPVLPL